MPTVSVIIPTYNRCGLLVRAIQSVLNQTFDDFELIVVDDGSTDKTQSVVKNFPDKRIRYIRQEHGERSRARNLGLNSARGEYIAFLDDDDEYLPNKLDSQVNFLSQNQETDLVASGAQIIDSEGNVVQIRQPWIKNQSLGLVDCLANCRLLMCSVLCRRQALDLMPKWFNPELSLAEDYDFWIRLAYSGCRMAWLPSVVCSYRTHRKGSAVQALGYPIACIKILDRFFGDNEVPETIKSQKDMIYAQRYVFAAMRSYAGETPALGQKFLSGAFSLNPSLIEGTTPKLIEIITDYASHDLIEEQEQFVDAVFNQLPTTLHHLKQFRKIVIENVRQSF